MANLMLGCEKICLEYPAKKVFCDVSLGIFEGDRTGIVGTNGDGKSSLLALVSGILEPDSGRVTARAGTSIAFLAQNDALDDEASVGASIVGDLPEYEWASDARIRDILGGLVADIGWDEKIGQLSGGQRRRVDLARVLIEKSDLLLLDEPTNHLDIAAIFWLAQHLKTRWPKNTGALLVVTHDRWFLDEVCLGMWEVHDGLVEAFEGGYSAYVLQRVERDEAARLAEQKRQNLMRRELAWLSRGARARATKPKFHLDAARALIADVPPLRNSLELKRSAISRLGKQVIDFFDVSMCFSASTALGTEPTCKVVLDKVTWPIGPGDRYGILGLNGTGKTTLLRLIEGSLKPTSGHIRIGKTVKAAYLSQRLEELDALGADRVREVLARYKTRYMIDGKEVTPSQLLERLGFEHAHLSLPVCDLSGGQKRRLQLMLILLDNPNVLILDEPGNDLDTDMLAAVENLLDSWPGTLILVTHDRYLMEHVTDHQFALLDGKIRHVPGGVDEFLDLLAKREQDTARKAQAADKGAQAATTSQAKATGHAPATLTNAQMRELKKQLSSTDRKLNTLHNKVAALQKQMHDADPSDYMTLGALELEIQDLQAQIAQMEDTWLALSEQLGN